MFWRSLKSVAYATLACACVLATVAAWELGTRGEIHLLYVPLFAALGSGFASVAWFSLWPPKPHPLAREYRIHTKGVEAVKKVLKPRQTRRKSYLWGL